MGQSTERLQQHLRAAPRWGCGRDVDHELARYLAQAAVDVCLVGELLFEEANPQARQGSFQCVELKREVHTLGCAGGQSPAIWWFRTPNW